MTRSLNSDEKDPLICLCESRLLFGCQEKRTECSLEKERDAGRVTVRRRGAGACFYLLDT